MDFSAEQKWAWICILCEASLQGKGTLSLDPEFHPVLWRIDRASLYDTVRILESKHILTIVSGGSSPAQTRRRIEEEEDKKNTYVGSDDPHPTSVGVLVTDFVNIYNDNCGQLSKVKALSEVRKRKANSAAKEFIKHGFTSDDLTKVIKFISADDFYSGKNKTGWRASFDFILQPGKLIELLEKANAPSVSQASSDSFKEYLIKQGQIDAEGNPL